MRPFLFGLELTLKSRDRTRDAGDGLGSSLELLVLSLERSDSLAQTNERATYRAQYQYRLKYYFPVNRHR